MSANLVIVWKERISAIETLYHRSGAITERTEMQYKFRTGLWQRRRAVMKFVNYRYL